MSYASRTPNPKNYGRKSGSFYDSIPSNLFQVIHKPSNDVILKQLKASTKNDKTAEWRMRTKYEEGCNREFDDLRKESILFGRHSSRTGYPTSNYRRSDRGKGSVAYYDYGPICGTSNVLDDKKNAQRIREHCRRRGRLYGPQAIEAVCGYPITKSIICGRLPLLPSPPLVKAPTCYDDHNDTFSLTSSTNSGFKHNHYNTVAKSSRSTDSNRMRVELGKLFSNPEPQSSGPLKNQGLPLPGRNKVSVQHAKSSDQTNQKYSTPRNNVQVSHSDNISHKLDSSKVSARSEGANTGATKNMKSARNVTKFQLKNLDKIISAPPLGGGDHDPGVSKSSKPLRQGKMRIPKKFRNQSSRGKKPLRRKPNVIKRKPLYVTNVLDDKRLKGPKIQGITSSSTIESIESLILEAMAPVNTIRTAVLPFPKAKYKRVMHD